jgi:hypothetical protein
MMHNTTAFTLHEAQALVGRTVRAKRARSYQIADGVLLRPNHTGTVIGVNGEYAMHDVPRIVLAVQIWPAAKRRRAKPRFFVLRLQGNVVGRIPYDGFDPLPFVVMLDKLTFETYFSLTS